jgi:hypothetical protein
MKIARNFGRYRGIDFLSDAVPNVNLGGQRAGRK